MGMFLDALFVHGEWTEDDEPVPAPPNTAWLSVNVHDSDIVSIAFSPTRARRVGGAYLHHTVRTYFEDDSVPPTDPDADADALTYWLLDHWPPSHSVADLRATVRGHLVGDEDAPTDEDTAFAEEALAELLEAVHLPGPPSLGPGS